MRQEINLLSRPPEMPSPLVSFTMLLGLSGVCVCLLIMVSIYQEKTLSLINKDIAEIERENVFQQKSITKSDDISQYKNKLSGLEKKLLSKYQLWANYKKITNAGKDGFSQYFYHIANLANKNLSLYEISVSERGNHLALKGYSTKAEDIPSYINNLKSKKELAHVTFGNLSIQKIEGHKVLRFILDKREGENKDGPPPIERKIDVSDIIKMSLSSHDVNPIEGDKSREMLVSQVSKGAGQ
jgi:Tfp pilus assembly protein PilN